MTYRRPDRVAFCEAPPGSVTIEPTVYLLRLPDGQPLRIDGTAALIWLLAAEGEPDVVASFAEVVGQSQEVVRASTEEYLDYLLREGLLVEE